VAPAALNIVRGPGRSAAAWMLAAVAYHGDDRLCRKIGWGAADECRDENGGQRDGEPSGERSPERGFVPDPGKGGEGLGHLRDAPPAKAQDGYNVIGDRPPGYFICVPWL